MATTAPRKPQVNVQLEPSEMAQLDAHCQRMGIRTSATLAGIWLRERLKNEGEDTQLIDLVREARASGVDVVRVLAKARRSRR